MSHNPMFRSVEPRPEHVNLDAEQALLGTLLTDNSKFGLLEHLQPKHFGHEVHGLAYGEVVRAYEQNRTVDAITLKLKADTWHEDGGKYIMQCVSAAMLVIDVRDYESEIISLYERRKLTAAFETALQMIEDYDQKPQDVIEWTANQMDESLPKSGLVTEKQMWESLKEGLKEPLAIHPIGLPRLQSAMGGGIHQGQLYALVGRTKSGKTLLAGTISQYLMNSGVKHLYLALEMGSDRIHERTAAQTMGVPANVFKTDYRNSRKCHERVNYHIEHSDDTRLWNNSPRMSLDALRREVVNAIKVHGITGFIVDSLQLVTGGDPKKSTAAHLDDVSQTLAELCAKYGVWCITTAQANQNMNIRDGEGLKLAADLAIIIMREEENFGSNRWIETMASRSVQPFELGSEKYPSLRIVDGTHFEELRAQYD